MTAIVRAQVIALRTLRTSYVVPLALLALVVFINVGSFAEAGKPDLTTPAQLREPIMAGIGIFVAVGLALLAAARMAGEYRYRTITPRTLAAPRRTSILGGFVLVYGLFAAVVGAVAVAVGLGVAVPMTSAKHLTLGLTPADLAAALLAIVLFSVIGVSTAVIVRSQPATVLLLVGAFFVERLLSLVLGNLTAYLPYSLLTPLLGLQGATISRTTAACTLLGITVVIAAVASITITRRDVH